MKFIQSSSVVHLILSLPLVWSTPDYKYVNSTSSVEPTTTPPPIFCGGCQLVYEVHASVWWPTVYTNYIATLVYTVDKDSGSTIGSEVQFPINTTAIGDLDYGVNFTSVYKLRDGGAVEYTYLNTLSNGPLTTVIQYNEITMNHTNWGNGYALSTQHINTSFTGTAATQCIGTYYTINGTTASDLPGLPSSTRYSYTTIVPFVETYNMSNVVTYGLDLFGSYVASYLNLSVPACTSPVGGGVGTLKVGVTALTARSTIFAEPQAGPTTAPNAPSVVVPIVTASPSSSPADSPSPDESLPSITTTDIPPEQPVSSPGQETQLVTSASVSFPDNEFDPVTIESTSSAESYTTTIATIITGPSGVETTSIIATLVVGTSGTSTVELGASETETPLESAILSTSSAATDADTSSSAQSSTPSEATPVGFTGSGNKTSAQDIFWASAVGVVCLIASVLSG